MTHDADTCRTLFDEHFQWITVRLNVKDADTILHLALSTIDHIDPEELDALERLDIASGSIWQPEIAAHRAAARARWDAQAS